MSLGKTDRTRVSVGQQMWATIHRSAQYRTIGI